MSSNPARPPSYGWPTEIKAGLGLLVVAFMLVIRLAGTPATERIPSVLIQGPASAGRTCGMFISLDDGPKLVAYLPMDPRFASFRGRHIDLAYLHSWTGNRWVGLETWAQSHDPVCRWYELNQRIVEREVLPLVGLKSSDAPSPSARYRFTIVLLDGVLVILAVSLALWLVPSTRKRFFPDWPARGGGRVV